MSTLKPTGGQRRLDEFVTDVDAGRCQAISVRHSRRCRHDSLPGVPYCATHYHLLTE